jgi:hypothetical protein
MMTGSTAHGAELVCPHAKPMGSRWQREMMTYTLHSETDLQKHIDHRPYLIVFSLLLSVLGLEDVVEGNIESVARGFWIPEYTHRILANDLHPCP